MKIPTAIVTFSGLDIFGGGGRVVNFEKYKLILPPNELKESREAFGLDAW